MRVHIGGVSIHGQSNQNADLTVDTVSRTGDVWTFTGPLVVQGFVPTTQGGEYFNGSSCLVGIKQPADFYGKDAKRDDLVVNTVDHRTWAFDGTEWVIIAEPPEDTRGTVTYLTDTEPVAPFDAANNWGFGPTAAVQPDPSVLEPEPDDVWIDYRHLRTGVFT